MYIVTKIWPLQATSKTQTSVVMDVAKKVHGNNATKRHIDFTCLAPKYYVLSTFISFFLEILTSDESEADRPL